MRVADPNGPWKKHPQQPSLMVRRAPTDAPGGEYFRVFAEGRIENYDGVNVAVAGVTGNAQGLDLNRNFPANWRQEFEQLGAGPFPTSEPEVRASSTFYVPQHLWRHQHSYFSGWLSPARLIPHDDKLPPKTLDLSNSRRRAKSRRLSGYFDLARVPVHASGAQRSRLVLLCSTCTWACSRGPSKSESQKERQREQTWITVSPIRRYDLKIFEWVQLVSPDTGLSTENLIIPRW